MSSLANLKRSLEKNNNNNNEKEIKKKACLVIQKHALSNLAFINS